MQRIPTRPRRPWNALIEDFLNEEFLAPVKGGIFKTAATNIKEKDDAYIVELAVPGLSKKDFSISIENDVLNVSSDAEDKAEDGVTYSRKEFGYSSFKRTFHLPESVDKSSISASYRNGVLIISLNKMESAKPQPARVVEVK